VLSVDAKKKENVGPFKTGGGRGGRRESRTESTCMISRLWRRQGDTLRDIRDWRRPGGVNVGVTHDTAEFAVESIRRWWKLAGCHRQPEAKRILICADSGGSNSSRSRSWKLHLQELADELGMAITVCHYPPGTSKWNKIEHRLFSFISLTGKGSR